MRLAMPVYGKNAKRELVTEFCGYNCTEQSYDGGGKSTFTEMLNGGTDKYPFAASRLPRRVTQYDEVTCALSGGEVLSRVQPPYLIYDNVKYDLGLTSGEKQIERMSTNILIFPDGKYFNTANGEFGDIDEGEEYSDGFNSIFLLETEQLGEITETASVAEGVSYTTTDGSVRTVVYTSLECFISITDTPTEALTVRTSSTIRCPLACKDGRLYYGKQWINEKRDSQTYMTNIEWAEVTVNEIGFTSSNTPAWEGLTNLWSQGEYVKVKRTGGTTFRIELLAGQTIGDVVTPESINASNELKFSYTWRTRTLPFFDYVTVCNNRLFGCRYGMPYDGSEPVNRIYASAPNDFKAFEQFAAISTDSWWGDVSEEGPFTGACTYNGYPMFFKEDYLYILYGDYPPYSFAPMRLRGVAVGAAKSLVEINNALYYKSRHDIMRYTGSSLNSISQALGEISNVTNAVGGTYRDGYYISLDGALYVYDTARGLWSKEDTLPIIDFASVRGETHFLTEGGAVYTVNGDEESMNWSLTSPPIGYAYPNRKRLSSLQIRIEIGEGDELPLVELAFDGGEFKECAVRVNFIDGEGKRTGTIFIPILPGRCELFKYRISGKGTYKLTGVTKTLKECGR